MATPADQRLLELLEKWLTSLELHLKYAALDADSYATIQPWPEHQRPSRWIIDLAKQKAIALRTQVEERIKMGDAKFSDSLELMTFLANLVGAEHIERFIPLAEPGSERVPSGASEQDQPPMPPGPSATGTREMPAFVATQHQAPSPGPAATGTREMPAFVATQRHAPPLGTAQVARTERKAAVIAKATPTAALKDTVRPVSPVKDAGAKSVRTGKPENLEKQQKFTAAVADQDLYKGPALPGTAPEAAREQVIADAARLVQWGRKWFELPELIARMADRPPLPDVRRILKDNKSAIDKKAGRSSK